MGKLYGKNIKLNLTKTKTTPAKDKRNNRIPGRDYDFGNGQVIRDHSGGHKYPDNPQQDRGSHINDVKGNHYDY